MAKERCYMKAEAEAKSDSRDHPPRYTIGGTGSVLVRGLSKYGGPHKLQRSMLDLDPPVKTNAAMHRGTVLEDPIGVYLSQPGTIERMFGGEGRSVGTLWGSGVINDPVYPCIHATIDRILYDEAGKPVGIIEIKTYDCSFQPYDWDRPDHPGQLEHYACVLSRHFQMTGKLGHDEWLEENYLVVLQAETSDFRALVKLTELNGPPIVADLMDSYDIKCRPAERGIAKRYSEGVLPTLAEWYERHVEPGVLNKKTICEPDGSEHCDRSLMLLRGEVPPDPPEPPSAGLVLKIQRKLEQRERAKVRKKTNSDKAKAEGEKIKKLESEIKLLMTEHGTVNTEDHTISIRRGKRRASFDKDGFEGAHPELFASFVREGHEVDKFSVRKRRK
jgi:hypothetical protein